MFEFSFESLCFEEDGFSLLVHYVYLAVILQIRILANPKNANYKRLQMNKVNNKETGVKVVP